MAFLISAFSSICAAISLAFFLTDPLDLRQPFRLFFHDPQRIRSEPPHNASRKSRSDPFYGAGAKIPFHRQSVLRHLLGKFGDLELFSVYRMAGVVSLSFYGRSLCDNRKGSHAGKLLFILYSL